MAERVELNVEDMIVELEQMEKLQIFNKEEVKTIKKKRKQFEYKCQRVSRNKNDLLRYIQYEMDLLKLLKNRMHEKGMSAKKQNMEFLLVTHIQKLFQVGTRRFPQDIKIWLSYIKFCKQVRYYSFVSRILDQMLLLHGATKPSLFKLAAQWEWEDNHSIERARKFIHQGLHLHKESQMLFIEGFRLELAFAQTKRQEAEDQRTLEANKEEPILSGKLADVIYESAIKKINNVSFLVQLLKVAEQFAFAENLQNKIIEEMKSKFPSEEETWDTLAKRELDQQGTLKEKTEKCIAVYQNGVGTVNTHKMWGHYLDYVLKVFEDLSMLPNYKKNCLKTAFEAAHNTNMLTEKYYFIWSRKAEESERGQILEWGTSRHPNSGKLWSALLSYHLARGEETLALGLFTRIKGNETISELASLWHLVLKYYQITDPQQAEKLWLEGANHPSVGASLKGKYIEWLAVLKGIIAARRAYESLAYNPPFSLELHLSMSKLEDAQPKLNLKCARLVYENALRQFGETNTDVWMWYIRFEEKFGNAKNVPVLYERALKTLKSQLVDGFVSEYNLSKADQDNTTLLPLTESSMDYTAISST